MRIGRALRAIILGLVFCGGSILGVPMRPEEIEELMSCMNHPTVEVTVDKSEPANEAIRDILSRMR